MTSDLSYLTGIDTKAVLVDGKVIEVPIESSVNPAFAILSTKFWDSSKLSLQIQDSFKSISRGLELGASSISETIPKIAEGIGSTIGKSIGSLAGGTFGSVGESFERTAGISLGTILKLIVFGGIAFVLVKFGKEILGFIGVVLPG